MRDVTVDTTEASKRLDVLQSHVDGKDYVQLSIVCHCGLTKYEMLYIACVLLQHTLWLYQNVYIALYNSFKGKVSTIIKL